MRKTEQNKKVVSNGESSRESGHPDLDWNRDVMTPFADLLIKSDSGADDEK